MSTHRAPRALRVLFPLAAAGAMGALALAPTAAMAETPAPAGPATATYGGPGVGYNTVIEGRAAGTIRLQVEGDETIEVYCVQYGVDMATTGKYVAVAKPSIKNLGKVADIAARHTQIGTKLSDPRAENVAAQLAIWTLTDAKDISKVPNAAIVKRAEQIAKGAKEVPGGPSGAVLTADVKVTGTGDDAKDVVTAKVTTPDGVPMADQNVTLTLGEAKVSGKTGAAGTVVLTLDAPEKASAAQLTLTTKVAAGTVFDPGSKQAVISTEAAAITRVTPVQMLGEPTPPPAPSPTPTHSAEETPSPVPTPTHTVTPPATDTPKPDPTPTFDTKEPKPKELPYTGGWVAPWMFAAAVGAAGAGVALKRRSNRRSH